MQQSFQVQPKTHLVCSAWLESQKENNIKEQVLWLKVSKVSQFGSKFAI